MTPSLRNVYIICECSLEGKEDGRGGASVDCVCVMVQRKRKKTEEGEYQRVCVWLLGEEEAECWWVRMTGLGKKKKQRDEWRWVYTCLLESNNSIYSIYYLHLNFLQSFFFLMKNKPNRTALFFYFHRNSVKEPHKIKEKDPRTKSIRKKRVNHENSHSDLSYLRIDVEVALFPTRKKTGHFLSGRLISSSVGKSFFR